MSTQTTKIFIYNFIFIVINILLIVLFNLKSRDHWMFQFLLFIWSLGLILISFLVSYTVKAYSLTRKLYLNLIITYALTIFPVTAFIALINPEHISFFKKILNFYWDLENFKFFAVPYIISAVTTLIIFFRFNKKHNLIVKSLKKSSVCNDD